MALCKLFDCGCCGACWILPVSRFCCWCISDNFLDASYWKYIVCLVIYFYVRIPFFFVSTQPGLPEGF
jgi:hypothetical protein